MKGKLLKTLCLLTALAMLAACIPAALLAKTENDTRDIWDGSIAGSFAGGSGTEANPYLISNGSQLALLAHMVNSGNDCSDRYFALTDDILLNATDDWEEWGLGNGPAHRWTLIGENSGNPFSGTFDGRDHTIRGLYTFYEADSGGLFGYADGAGFARLNIAESSVNGKWQAGGIVAIALNSSFEDCTNAGGVYAVCAPSHSEGTGGIAGKAANCTFTDCGNSGYIQGLSSYNVGGIVGYAEYCGVIGCGNSGVVDCLNSTGIGGIVGKIMSGGIEDCSNTGDIVREGSRSVGGIAGEAHCGVYDCTNSGAVSALITAGGIVGEFDGDECIENCINEGAVDGVNDIGGIVGKQYGGTVRFCKNYGDISADAFSSSYGTANAAGIVGFGRSLIVGCVNNGTVTVNPDQYMALGAGGIAADSTFGVVIENCINNGSVLSVGGAALAGIIPENKGSITRCVNNGEIGSDPQDGSAGIAVNNRGSISECFNTGTVYGQNAGGIAGDQDDSDSVIENCFNIGSINAESWAGGILTNRYTSSTERCCYNIGTVSGGEISGAVIGRCFDADNAAEACYYLAGCCEDNGVGTALTEEQLRNAESYAGFDFESIWTMDGDPDYPYAELVNLTGSTIIPGDVDGSGTVNVSDAIMALRASMGLLELTNDQFTAADMDGSNTVTVSDAIMILRTAMGLV